MRQTLFPLLTASPDPSASSHHRMAFNLGGGGTPETANYQGASVLIFKDVRGNLMLLRWWKVPSFGL